MQLKCETRVFYHTEVRLTRNRNKILGGLGLPRLNRIYSDGDRRPGRLVAARHGEGEELAEAALSFPGDRSLGEPGG